MNKLQDILSACGKTQDGLSNRCGVSQGTLSLLCLNKITAKRWMVDKIMPILRAHDYTDRQNLNERVVFPNIEEKGYPFVTVRNEKKLKEILGEK